MLSPKNKLADHYSAIYLLAAGYAAAAPTPLLSPFAKGAIQGRGRYCPGSVNLGNMSGSDSDDAGPVPVTHEAL